MESWYDKDSREAARVDAEAMRRDGYDWNSPDQELKRPRGLKEIRNDSPTLAYAEKRTRKLVKKPGDLFSTIGQIFDIKMPR